MQTSTQADRVISVSAAQIELSTTDASTALHIAEEDQLLTRPQSGTSATRLPCILDNGPRRRAPIFWQQRDVVASQFTIYSLWHKSFRWCTPDIEAEMQMRLHNCLGAVGLDPPDLCLRARMMSRHGYSGDPDGPLFSLLLAILPLLYGGAHVAAWNSHFPTEIEGELWRVCAIIATCYVTIAVLLPFLIDPLTPRIGVVGESVDICCFFGVSFGALLFFCARAFLTVESFLSLRSLPQGSFQTVSWSNYWPHF